MLALLGWTAAGCEETIALGSDCPPFGKRCIRVAPPDTPVGAPPAENDAGGVLLPLDGGQQGNHSGGAASDGGANGGGSGEPIADASIPDLSPRFANASFELAPGRSAGQLDSVISAKIAPWYTCSGSVSARLADDLRNTPSGEPRPIDILQPSDGTTLVSLSSKMVPGSLFQPLEAPLVAGQRYAFAIDVVRSGPEKVRLHLYGSDASCVPKVELAKSPVIPLGRRWRTVCMSFTAPSAFPQLAIIGSGGEKTRLFIDNIRSHPACR